MDSFTCDFTSFFNTVFHLYQDVGHVKMKGCVQWNLVYGWKDFRTFSFFYLFLYTNFLL